jgi:lysophospholipase L1-like esterase
MAGMLRALLFLCVSVSTTAQLAAQLADDFNPPRSACCLPNNAQTLANQLQDWNQLGRYHADNVALRAQPVPAGRVVFMGDSITDGWKLAEQFPGKPYVNRGIGGQTTPQMLVRMFQDVIDLHPSVMVVLAGTNDIARNTGPLTLEMIGENLQAMTELAQGHGIKVVLCSVMSISDYVPNRPQSKSRPPADILKLNAWIKEYAAKSGAIFADYYAATVDDKGMLKEGFSADGLHPNEKGYALLAPVATAAIEKALQK